MKLTKTLLVVILTCLVLNVYAAAVDLLNEPRLSQILDSLGFDSAACNMRATDNWSYEGKDVTNNYIEFDSLQTGGMFVERTGNLNFYKSNRLVKSLPIITTNSGILHKRQICYIVEDGECRIYDVEGNLLHSYKTNIVHEARRSLGPISYIKLIDYTEDGFAIIYDGHEPNLLSSTIYELSNSLLILDAKSQQVFRADSIGGYFDIAYTKDLEYLAILKSFPWTMKNNNQTGFYLTIYGKQFEPVFSCTFDSCPNCISKSIFDAFRQPEKRSIMAFVDGSLLLTIKGKDGLNSFAVVDVEQKKILSSKEELNNFASVDIEQKKTQWSKLARYNQTNYKMDYWNERFPVLADSIHKAAQNYYTSKKVFKPQKKNEKNSDYILRMLNTYNKVKKHEYTPFLAEYKKMFEAYAKEIELPVAIVTMGDYITYSKGVLVHIAVGYNLTNNAFIEISEEQASMLRKVWDKCTKRVWGSYGIDSQLRPSRIFIQTPDKEYTYSGNLDYIDKIEYKGTYATIVPIRNRNLFYIEPPASPEYLFDPSLKSLEPANHHLYCAGAASNLMANRLAGRMGYNSETKEYQLLKIDFNLSASPLVYAKFKVKERDYRYLMCTGLSPDGRIIVQGMPESIHFYDFDSGKLLDSLAFNGKYSYGKNSYVFDPFHKKLYISTSEKTEVYEFKTGKLSSHALEATQIKADNSNMHMAYWNDKSNLLHIMNLKHQAVKVFGLPDLENVDVRQINAVDFSADDRLIAVLANKGFGKTCLYVYDLKHEKLLRKIELFDFVNLSFTNDGQNLLCSSNGNEVINVIHLGIQPEELK